MSWGEYIRWVLAILNLACCVYLFFEIARWRRRIRSANRLIEDVKAHPERYVGR